MENSPIAFCRLSATIAGDSRYTDTLTASYHPDTRSVSVVVTETGAAGGMDGPGGSAPASVSLRLTTSADPTPKQVLELVKRAIANKSFSFRSYGKPTQNTRWRTDDGWASGLSVSHAKLALSWAVSVAAARAF